MDFAQQQRNPAKHLVGFTAVVLLHALVIWALVTGLARKAIEVIKEPLVTKIIEEIKPPPPPDALPPPPKLEVPPPPFIPPPEVNIQTPAPVNTITAVTTVKPEAPPPPVRVEAPPTPPKPAVATVGVACPNVKAVAGEFVYPVRAQRDGINSGEVLLQFTVAANGEIRNMTVVKSSNRVFNNAALDGARMLKCVGQGQDVTVQWPIVFKTAD